MKFFRGLLLRIPDSGDEGLVEYEAHEDFFADYFCGIPILEVRMLCRVRQAACWLLVR
jgi:hypothetical protein